MEQSLSRLEKAREITGGLDGQLRVSILGCEDRAEYKGILHDIVSNVCTGGRRIQNKESQLESVVSRLTPMQLARAICQGGNIQQPQGPPYSLAQLCGITENTQSILMLIAQDIRLLNKLQTTLCPDILKILVRRRGETNYADLRTALSQGEQSAAILTLALQSRAMPLILDQPEDELGYSYVVHLVVPRILQAKFSRQLLVVTHNANIPVLGDADYVIKMENRPRDEASRSCVAAKTGCFEADGITQALIELEGGPQAFQFRKHRYSLPRA